MSIRWSALVAVAVAGCAGGVPGAGAAHGVVIGVDDTGAADLPLYPIPDRSRVPQRVALDGTTLQVTVGRCAAVAEQAGEPGDGLGATVVALDVDFEPIIAVFGPGSGLTRRTLGGEVLGRWDGAALAEVEPVDDLDGNGVPELFVRYADGGAALVDGATFAVRLTLADDAWGVAVQDGALVVGAGARASRRDPETGAELGWVPVTAVDPRDLDALDDGGLVVTAADGVTVLAADGTPRLTLPLDPVTVQVATGRDGVEELVLGEWAAAPNGAVHRASSQLPAERWANGWRFADPDLDVELGLDFGRTVIPTGDWDGDGVLELVVAGPHAAGVPYAGGGVLRVLDGQTGATLVEVQEDPPGDSLGTELGASLASVVDLDRDGLDELVVGMPGAHGGDGAVAALACRP